MLRCLELREDPAMSTDLLALQLLRVSDGCYLLCDHAKTLTQHIEFVPQCVQVVAHVCPVIVSGLLFRFGSQAFNHFQLGVGMFAPVEHRAERADSPARNTATRGDESSYGCDPRRVMHRQAQNNQVKRHAHLPSPPLLCLASYDSPPGVARPTQSMTPMLFSTVKAVAAAAITTEA